MFVSNHSIRGLRPSTILIKALTTAVFQITSGVVRTGIMILFMISTNSFLRGQSSPTPPNIILIIADDIGWNDLGCYGNKVVATPHIDRIASEGLKFTNAYLTTSSCSPSRTSIISGRYPHNTGSAELHTPLPEGIAIFPELLQETGYYTAQAGKWHMGGAARRGFDLIRDSGSDLGPGGEEMWVSLIRERPGDRPFFLWLASTDAHRPWNDNEFKGQHDPDQIEIPPFLVNDEATRRDLALYYDEIARFDHYVGEVENELEREGIADNTILMIVSDNGRPFPRSKTRLYDSGIKTPLIIKWPDGMDNNGGTCHSLVSAIDIAPTILDLAGAKISSGFQGRSFRKLLEEPDLPFRNYIFAEHNWHDHEALERMVRTRDFMYILNLRPAFPNQGPADSNNSDSFSSLRQARDNGILTAAQVDVFASPRPREELYDCLRDPLQLVNIVADPHLKGKLAELRTIMRMWMEQTGDSNPDKLTPDWYSRESGEALDIERKRGEMPGASTHATEIDDPGPF